MRPARPCSAVTVAALMVAVTEAGAADPGLALAAGGVSVLAGGLFAWQERRAPDPMVATRLWTRRPIATANAATLLAGMAIIGLTTFLPMHVQGVLNQSALVAGFALTVMSLGWPVGATLTARNAARFGLRPTLLFGAALLPLGAAVFLGLGIGSSPLVAGVGSLVMGLGMGFLSTSSILIIQDAVEWEERGAATASNVFARNLGSTFGATVLGGVLNASLAHGGPAAVEFGQVRELLSRAGGIADAAVRAALGHALHLTFWGVFLISLLTLLVAVLVPSVRMRPAPSPAAGE